MEQLIKDAELTEAANQLTIELADDDLEEVEEAEELEDIDEDEDEDEQAD